MKARKIPKNYRNLTGLSASKKSTEAYFESSLERDFISVLEFDAQVQTYDVQPVTIEWCDNDGKKRKYTPDALVNFFPSLPIKTAKKLLCEVKYRSDLKDNWLEYKPKFKAAIKYARNNGYRFKIMTEVEIRTHFMENATFLLPYLNHNLDDAHEKLIMDRLKGMRQCSIEAIIKSIFNDKWLQAEVLTSLWKLVALRRISTDLNLPLTMSSTIWI